MTDDEILGGILRRWITDGVYRYYFWDDDHLSLDADIDITPDEAAALNRIEAT